MKDKHVETKTESKTESKNKYIEAKLVFKYLKAKIVFTENIVNSLMDLHDKGGTLPVFPTFEEWKRG